MHERIYPFYLLIIILICQAIIFEVSAKEFKNQNQQEIYNINKIFELYYNQKFEECMAYCKNFINQDIDNTVAYVFYFSSSFQLDKLQEVINQIDDEYIKYIQNYNSKKQNEIIESQKEYQKLTILSAYSNLFMYFYSGSQYYIDEATNILRKSLFFPVNFSSIYTGLGIVYYEKKLTERALSMINKSLNIKPYDPIALEYYAKIQNNLGNYNLTIEKLKNHTYIKYPDMLYQLAFAYEKNINIEKAIETYESVYKYDPFLIGQGFISLIRIGDIYLNIKNDKENAIKYYQEVLKILPDSLVAKQKIEEAKNKNNNSKNK